MRWILPLCLAALCALVSPGAAHAAPRAADFEVRLGTVGPTAHAAAAGAWTSPVVRPGRTFSIVGLRWRRAPEHLHAQVRVRDADGWHRWTELPHAHSGRASDPVWAGRATAVQLRLSRRVKGLELHFVAVSGATARARPRTPVARAAAAQPAIVPRAQWAADQCPPRDAPTMGTVQMAFVHHTVSANEYGPGDSAAMVLGICRFHRYTNGWDDVGYNFFVDKYGQIFEGRAGGVDQPVVGAQAQGWNAQSTGIANLGTYTDVPQTEPALDALARLIAWKLPLHGVPVTGTVTLRSAGGESNRFPAGTDQTFQRISGHRDGNSTACPGEQLYAQLPRLRALADAHAPAVIPGAQPTLGPGSKLSLSASRRALSYPEPAQLAGQLLTASGAPVGGQRIRIQVLTGRGFKAVASAVTGPDGAYRAALPTSRNRVVRALIGKLASNRVTLRVAPALAVTAPLRRVKAGRRSVVTGRLRPMKGTVVVEAARQAGGRYQRALAVRVRASSGRFRAALPLRRPGLYRLRVRFAGDARNTPAQRDFYVRAVRRMSQVGAQPAAAR